MGNGNLLQYSCLENFKHRGASRVTVQGVAESDMIERLSRAATLLIHIQFELSKKPITTARKCP